MILSVAEFIETMAGIYRPYNDTATPVLETTLKLVMELNNFMAGRKEAATTTMILSISDFIETIQGASMTIQRYNYTNISNHS